MTKTDLRERLAREGEARLREGYHRSEAVLMTPGPYGTPLGSSVRAPGHRVCRRRRGHDDLCGALAGGVMVLGAALGRTTIVDDHKLMALVEFRRRSVEAYGITCCETIRATVIKNEGGLGKLRRARRSGRGDAV